MRIGAIDMGGSKSIVAILDENFEILITKRFEGHEKDYNVHFDRVTALLGECRVWYRGSARSFLHLPQAGATWT